MALKHRGLRELDHLKLALEAQTKFDYYFVGLIFTLLALSIQSAKFGNLPFVDVAELLGWLGLLASGLIALGRLRYGIAEHLNIAKAQEFHQRQQWYDEQQGDLPSDYIDRAIDHLQERIKRSEKEADRISGRRGRFGQLQMALFVVALMLIIAARSSGPLLGVLSATGDLN